MEVDFVRVIGTAKCIAGRPIVLSLFPYVLILYSCIRNFTPLAPSQRLNDLLPSYTHQTMP